MKFPQRLKELRLSQGISQLELSKRLGISPSAVSMYERGEREPSFELEEAIADYFNVDILYLRGSENVTTEIVTGDAHLLLEMFKRLDESEQKMVLGYIRALADIHDLKEENRP